jgi:glycosyltransferase involved in cell wall biosynthesis
LKNLPIFENVIVVNLGKIEKIELAKIFSGSNVIINTNEFETFSMFVAEGMASGVIPIVSDGVGISEYIYNGKNGFVFSNRDYNKLIEIIYDLIDGNINAQVIVVEARKIYNILNWDKIIDRYEEIYRI